MTIGGRTVDRPGAPSTAGLALAALLALSADARGQGFTGDDIGDGLADQIGAPPREPVSVDEIAPAPPGGPDSTRIDPITEIGNAEAVTIEQGTGGRDLCDPSVPGWEARSAGVDCAEGGATLPADALAPGDDPLAVDDPLLERREPGAVEAFDALNLGSDVPATVILQQ